VSSCIVHIVGARPNFMKAAPVVDALKSLGATQQVIHTGQHYDERMSDVFFEQLGLPEPDVNLGVGSGSHASQTAQILVELEGAIDTAQTAAVVVYGDVNSTLAAALLCSKVGIPLIHVEAGLRSFDRSMPEEVNRVLTDAVSDLLFVTSPEGLAHLADEGIAPSKMRFVGNPMIDTLVRHRQRFDPSPLKKLYELPAAYGLVTLHRPSNVDDPVVASMIVDALRHVAQRLPLVIPLHPRGRQRLADLGLVAGHGLRIVEPLGYVQFLSLVSGASLVITDSGGVQEETTILDVPCLTVRANTERPITITHGTNRLVQPEDLAATAASVIGGAPDPPTERPPLWDGEAGPRIASEIVAFLGFGAVVATR
jgi:UDP-N-acetylglucosamine 2-epimerase (non-hydrolysing)